jgi:Ca2+-binding RTX toxin-like protein
MSVARRAHGRVDGKGRTTTQRCPSIRLTNPREQPMADIANSLATTAVFDGDPSFIATFSGGLESFDDRDWIRITFAVTTTYDFYGSVEGSGANSGGSEIKLFNASGVEIAGNGNATIDTTNSFVRFIVPAGTYFVEMSSFDGLPGSYSIVVQEAFPIQRLTLGADDFSVDGPNTIVGDKGDDTIDLVGTPRRAYGEQGDDTLTGDSSGNFISGGLGNDTIFGRGDNDRLFGDSGDDLVSGEDGDDLILGGDGADVVDGGVGADQLFGGGGSDFVNGGADADHVDGGAGQDRLRGGAGADQLFVDNAGDQVLEAAGEGDDTVFAAVSFALAAGSEVEILRSSAPVNAAINFTGNEFGNTLIGNDAVNVLAGKGGLDTLVGGAGNDFYVLEDGNDVVQDAGGAADFITSTVSRSLSSYAGIERLTLAGNASIGGTGNAGNNVIAGNAGANVINGLGGLDNLTGGAGTDTFVFSTAPGATNMDTVMDFIPVDDTLRLENAVFTRLTATGVLGAGNLRIGAAAADANDFIVYNNLTGALIYDSNGNGAGGAVQFAWLANKPGGLTAGDFVVI